MDTTLVTIFILTPPENLSAPTHRWHWHLPVFHKKNFKIFYIKFLGSTYSRYWQIRVDQIPCGTPYTPPTGCLQYMIESSGNFKSFNYGINDDDYHSLGTQDYAICFRRNKGKCKIEYSAAVNEGESFYTSQTPTTPAVRSKAGESGCPADYLNIPNAGNSVQGLSVCSVILKNWRNFTEFLLFRIHQVHWLKVGEDIVAEDLTVTTTQHQTPISTLLLFLLSFRLTSMELRHLQTTRTEDSALIITSWVASYLKGANTSVVLITVYA